ncbi:22.0 kDa heat shock protein [Abeliophyllum distichum]|uniref:22.0 kDa heat shock protein n=1 Tax=Abeliophyllum distichum TaxID=126358 RepID=A0ABD1TKZ6_9LAMI
MKLVLSLVLYFSCILQLMLLSQSQGSLLPLSDRLLLSVDPFRVLEQVPLALEREESMEVLPAATVDWKETTLSHVIMLDVPGLKKEDLKIEVEENRVLLISGERKMEEENKTDHWHHVERTHGKFWRRFRLPDNVNLDRVEAKLENGVLIISMPKLSPDVIKGPRAVEIAESGRDHQLEESLTNKPKEEL